MILLHNIGRRVNSNYNSRQEVMACDEALSCDGVYKSIYDNMDILAGKDVTLFVMGDYVGLDNHFDAGQIVERLCNWSEIIELVTKFKCKMGWHTWSHPDLTALAYQDVVREITPPFPMDYFAYPYGKFNAHVIEAVRRAGFKEAWGVFRGDGTAYQRTRRYLNW